MKFLSLCVQDKTDNSFTETKKHIKLSFYKEKSMRFIPIIKNFQFIKLAQDKDVIQVTVFLPLLWASLLAQMVKNLPAMWETRVCSLG